MSVVVHVHFVQAGHAVFCVDSDTPPYGFLQILRASANPFFITPWPVIGGWFLRSSGVERAIRYLRQHGYTICEECAGPVACRQWTETATRRWERARYETWMRAMEPEEEHGDERQSRRSEPYRRSLPTPEGPSRRIKDAAKRLDLTWPTTKESVVRAFRAAALRHHPDTGGSDEKMRETLAARDALMAEL